MQQELPKRQLLFIFYLLLIIRKGQVVIKTSWPDPYVEMLVLLGHGWEVFDVIDVTFDTGTHFPDAAVIPFI